MKQIVACIAVAVLVGCSNPKSVEIPRGTGQSQVMDKKFSNALNELTEEERKLVNGYLYFTRLYGDSIPDNFTIGNAIDYMYQFRSSYMGAVD